MKGQAEISPLLIKILINTITIEIEIATLIELTREGPTIGLIEIIQ